LIKQILQYSNENFLTVVVAYNLLAAIIAIAISVAKGEYKNIYHIENKKKLSILIFLNGFYDVLLVSAIAFTTVVQFAVIANYLWPILLVLFIGIKTGHISINPIIGAAIGFGAVFIVLIPDKQINISNSNDYIGIGFGILAAVFWALYSTFLEKQHERIAITIQGLSQLVSALAALILAIFLMQFNVLDILNFKAFVLIFLYATINMSFAYVLWITVVVRHSELHKFASMFYVLPLLSILISTIWFENTTGDNIWFATALIIFGIFVSRIQDS
jgi:drug/metabolite transporter (DMT)-like permease